MYPAQRRYMYNRTEVENIPADSRSLPPKYLSSLNNKPKLIKIVKAGKKPYQSVSLLLNRKSILSLEHLMQDISEAFGLPNHRNYKICKLYSAKGDEISGVGDFFRDQDSVVIGATARNPVTGDELVQILEEVLPNSSLSRKLRNKQLKEHVLKADSGIENDDDVSSQDIPSLFPPRGRKGNRKRDDKVSKPRGVKLAGGDQREIGLKLDIDDGKAEAKRVDVNNLTGVRDSSPGKVGDNRVSVKEGKKGKGIEGREEVEKKVDSRSPRITEEVSDSAVNINIKKNPIVQDETEKIENKKDRTRKKVSPRDGKRKKQDKRPLDRVPNSEEAPSGESKKAEKPKEKREVRETERKQKKSDKQKRRKSSDKEDEESSIPEELDFRHQDSKVDGASSESKVDISSESKVEFSPESNVDVSSEFRVDLPSDSKVDFSYDDKGFVFDAKFGEEEEEKEDKPGDELVNDVVREDGKEKELLETTENETSKSDEFIEVAKEDDEVGTDGNNADSLDDRLKENSSPNRDFEFSGKSGQFVIRPRQICSDREVLERYRLGEKVGDGNFADVHAGVLRSTGEEFAIKKVDKSKLKGKESMIENEIAILKEIDHPNIVKLYEEFETDDYIYLIMDYIRGGDLFDAIIDSVKFTEADASVMVRDLARALDYLHKMNVVHRDMKPENLLVNLTDDSKMQLKLADFGLAMEVVKPVYTVCGTPTYVAPEILAETGYGLPVDMWALGVITYILLCGFPPFRSPDRSQDELFDLIQAGKYEYIAPYWNSISKSAKDLIDNLLVVDQKKRFTAVEVLHTPLGERRGTQ
ncbi:putative serine/threonine-protein kinase DCLK3 isoform X5 [Apostichopus japonicus]|uniref:non-specific serine/threonine protein kinase n=1 Tax=Stichopus japonicus TaxID=307972 RepID=A0A2G8JHG1_STIJA|nr:putative serine/threonine-protein kinase DCLK3 isoform X5 [Apostichopus japonicus]